MTLAYDYQQLLKTSHRINWRLEDLVGEGKRLDFSRPFLPETFARVKPLEFLSAREQLLLNHIRARGYLGLFELVETFIVPFLSKLENGRAEDEAFRAPALHNFVVEEEKHRQMFTAVLAQFDAAFPVPCALIGPASDICAEILRHQPLAIALAILGLEWMSQAHYVESVRDDQDLDRQFKSLLRHHWLEECQHAKLDTLILRSLAREASAQTIDAAVAEYFEIGAFLDAGLKAQASLDLQSLEGAAGRALSEDERARFLEVQHRAQQWTFLGTAMGNRNFLETLASISASAAQRVALAAQTFTLH